MQKTVNRVTIIGVVDREPEVRDFPSGGQVLSLWVKTSEQWNDRQTGETRERSQINRVSVYVAPMINALKNTLQENDLVYVEGRMETRRTQDQHGNDRYFTEVSVRPYHGSIATLGQIQISEAAPDRNGGFHNSNDSGGPQQSSFESSSTPDRSDAEDSIPF